MTKDELLAVHPVNKAYTDRWNFWGLAYEGGEDFIKFVLKQNVRESSANWVQRIEEGVNFNYCAAIIDLFNFYLTEKPVTRVLGGLETDELWQQFLKDCDFKGTNFDTYLNEISKMSSIYSHVGVFVNKAASSEPMYSRYEEIKNNLYPHLCVYTPQNIMDWDFKVTQFGGRPQLVYLKLREDNGNILVMTLSSWEIWRVRSDGGLKSTEQIELIDSGENGLGIIPFFWSYNMRSPVNQNNGISDVREISNITASICRNLSSGDEIIKYAGFPMLRTPMEAEGQASTGSDIMVSPRGVLEFNPEMGAEGKPDWLESEVLEPVEAILNWTDRKVDEVYRVAHLSGVHGQRKSNNEVASGLALRYEFQQLNSVLGKKSDGLCEAELEIIRFWLIWQGKYDLFKEVEVIRSKQFSVEDLSISLDNCEKAMKTVLSNHFKKLVQKSMVKQVLPDMSEKDVALIHQEIETGVDKMKTEQSIVQPELGQIPSNKSL